VCKNAERYQAARQAARTEEKHVAMSSPNRKRLKLQEMRHQAVDALGMEPGIELELDGQQVVFVPNPVLAPDGVQELLNDNKVVEAARLILGDTEHDKLLQHGGHSNDVMLAWRIMQKDLDGAAKSE
jgi:hypothetical protein